jgi:hypothetical protein
VRYLLSRDRRAGGDVALAGGRRVGALGAKKSSSGLGRVKVSGRARRGSYFLIACADGARRVRERSEANNCRVARRRVRVVEAFRPRPVDVRAAADEARAVSLAVGTGGGTLEATAADGTRFVLTIPPNAMSSTDVVTMTPTASIAGIPFSTGSTAAVILGPDGLRFVRPAKLTIFPSQPIPVAEQVGFSAEGTGHDFHLDVLSPDPSKIELELFHFTLGGVAQAPQFDFDRYGQRVPTRREAWARQSLAELMAENRQAVLRGDEPRSPDSSAYVSLFVWANEGVLPLATAAATNDERYKQALTDYLAWDRQQELLSIEDPDLNALDALIRAQLRKAFVVYVDRTYERCLAGDLTKLLDILGVAYTAQVLGAVGEDGTTVKEHELIPEGIDLTQTLEKVNRCARFELDYEFRFKTPNFFRSRSHDEGHVRALSVVIHPFTQLTPPPPIVGQKDLDYVSFTPAARSCFFDQDPTVYSARATAPFVVASLEFDTWRNDPPRYLVLKIDPGDTEERVTCNPQDDPDGVKLTAYRDAFTRIHSEELFERRYLIARWTDLGGRPYGTSVIARSKPQGSCCSYEGTSTWVLRHAPDRTRTR